MWIIRYKPSKLIYYKAILFQGKRMPELPIFVVNLDGSDDRLSKISTALNAQGGSFTRISAYDGRKANQNDIPEYDFAGCRNYIGRDLNRGEIGCYFSHIFAAKQFLATGAKFGLVLEDDAELSTNAIALVKTLVAQQTKAPKKWFLCHLADPKMKFLSAIETFAVNDDRRTLYRAHYFPMTATALLWSRTGAQEFLNTCLPMQCPVDNFMRKWLITNDCGIAVQPPIFSTTGASSEIDRVANVNTRNKEKRVPFFGAKKARRIIGEKIKASRYLLCFRMRKFFSKQA